MDFLNYLIVSIIAYLGLVAGYVLMLVAPEEKKPGMKYFNALNYFLFILFAFFVVFFRFPNLLFVFGSVIAAIAFYFFKKYQIHIAYLFFSVIFYLFSESSTAFLIFSVIIFAYGLVTGAIIIDLKDKRKSLLRIISLAYFIITAILLKSVL